MTLPPASQHRLHRRQLLRTIILTTVVTAFLYLVLATAEQASAASHTHVPTAPGKISGRVTDETGTPLAGIAVCVSSIYAPFDCQDGQPFVLTNANGDYQITGLGAGQYQIHFHDPTNHYFGEYFDNVPLDSNGAVITPVLVVGNQVSNINAMLTAAGQITGTLTLASAPSYVTNSSICNFNLTSGNMLTAWTTVQDSDLRISIDGDTI